MTQSILITGGLGFIGTNFIQLLSSRYPDLEIVNLDSLDFPICRNNHQKLNSNNYHFIQGSILDKTLVRELFQKYKFHQVINFAAKSHVDTSIANPEIFVTNNILGSQTLLDAALHYEVDRFIQISTDEVYGSLELEAPSTTELSSIEPNNPYSASKAGADCLARAYHKTYALPLIITRSSNNFGPYQYPEKFIPMIISNALNDQPIPVYGTGLNIRDWIFVEENCKALDLIRNKGQIGQTYNIPGHKEITNIEICKLILSILSKPESLISFVEDRKGHDFRYSMDGSKLENLGFNLSSSFEENLIKTIEWYKNNKAWLMPKTILTP